MAFTNFTSLGIGPGTTPQLDANFSTLSQLANIPVTVSGTNTLTLTQSTATSALTLQNYLVLEAIASATNTGPVTANFNSTGGLNVYKDTPSGPVLLVGGEIVLNCRFSLIYDSTLNSNVGGYHLSGGGNSNAGNTITAQSVNATLGSIASLTVSSFFGTSVSLSSLQIGGVINPLVRMQSTLVSFSVTSGNAMAPGAEVQATISFAGAAVGDAIALGAGQAIAASLIYSAYVPAAGSVIFRAHNAAVAATITVSLFTIRLVDIGFAS